MGELQKGVLSGQGAEEAGSDKVRKSVNINTLPHSEIHRDLRATMSLTCLSPLMPDSYCSICCRFVKLGPKRKYIKFCMCSDSGSFYNVLPLALVKKYQMLLDLNHKGLSATDMNGGDFDIKEVVKMIILVGDGTRKQVSFIVCDLPSGKEPLLNFDTSIALGVLPGQFPKWDYTSGKKYKDEDIIHLFGGSGVFDIGTDGIEEECEFDELGFNIRRNFKE